MKTELMKFAYLLDQDNYCVENKIFIDLMWHIAKTKEDKDKNLILKSSKSYVIRNAAIMFQQIFYWHFNAIKNSKPTKYRYKEQNVVKMDYEDWWNSIRLTDTEVTTANKFLLKTELIEIVKMRIKQKDADVFKPSNCYMINVDALEKYLTEIVEISKDMYIDKVEKVRELNNKTSLNHRYKRELSTEKNVTPETWVTLKIEESQASNKTLSTLLTPSTGEISPVTLETGVTEVTSETGVTEVTSETRVTNKSNTSYTNTSCANDSEENLPSRSAHVTWNEISEQLKTKMSGVSFNTWFQSSIAHVKHDYNKIDIFTINEFSADILRNKYIDLIQLTISELTTQKININITNL